VASSTLRQLHEWQTLFGNDVATSIVAGARVSLLPGSQLPHRRPPEFHGSRAAEECIATEIGDLLDKGAIRELPPSEWWTAGCVFSTLFTVPKADGTLRPCLNLKPCNLCIRHRHFHMEGIETVKELLHPGDWFGKIDLRDAYLQVSFAQDLRRLLRFTWRGRAFECLTLIFGLSEAPWLFTKVMRAPVKYLRTLGIRVVIYLDDLLFIADSPELLRAHMQIALDLFQRLGLQAKVAKCVTTPTRIIEFLGYTLNSVEMSCSLPDRKVLTMMASARLVRSHLLTKTGVPVLALERLLGRLSAASFAIWPTRLHMAGLLSMHRAGLAASSGERVLQLTTTAALDDLDFWMSHLRNWNGRSLFRDPTPDYILESDAAKVGWGIAWRRDPLTPEVTRGLFSLELRRSSSNTRELHAAIFGLMAMIQHFNWSKVTVLLRTDNITTLHYVRRMGGRLIHLTRALLPLAEFLREREIRLLVDYLPGIWNLLADPLSRQEASVADAHLLPEAFRLLEERWGPHQVDLMASAVNHQIPNYISHLPDAGALWTNLFTWYPNDAVHGWYCFPPVARVGRVLQWAVLHEVPMTLVVPDWPSQPWWPLLLTYLSDVPLVFPPQPALLSVPAGSLEESLQWTMIGCRLSFGSSAERVSQIRQSLSLCAAGQMVRGRGTTLDGVRGRSIASDAISVLLTLPR
jgi:hypothetical protein